MRHLRSILYALVLAPAVWILCGVGFTQDLTGRARDAGSVETASAILLLVLAGAAYAILIFSPISPLGPALFGLLFLGISLWAVIAPDSYAGVWPAGITKEGFDLSRPGYALAVLLAIPMLCTALSVRRWRGYEAPELPLIGTLGRARGAAVAPGVPVAAERTAIISTADPTEVMTLPVQAPPAEPPTEAVPTQVVPVVDADEPTVLASSDEPTTTVMSEDRPDDEPTVIVTPETAEQSGDEPTVLVVEASAEEPTAQSQAADDAGVPLERSTGTPESSDEPTVVFVDEPTDPTSAVEEDDEPDEDTAAVEEPAGIDPDEIKDEVTAADAAAEGTEEATEPLPDETTATVVDAEPVVEPEPEVDAEPAAGEAAAADAVGPPATPYDAKPAADADEDTEPTEAGTQEVEASTADDEPTEAQTHEVQAAASAVDDEPTEAQPRENDDEPTEATTREVEAVTADVAEAPEPADDGEERTQVIRLPVARTEPDPDEPTHRLDRGDRTQAAGPGENTQVIFWREPVNQPTPEQAARARAAADQAARDQAAQERARQAFRDRAAQERAKQAFAERAAQDAREHGEQTQVINLSGMRGQPIPGDQTQVLPGAGQRHRTGEPAKAERAGDRTQKLPDAKTVELAGDQTQVLPGAGGPPGDRTQVLSRPGTVEPPGDRTQVLSFPPQIPRPAVPRQIPGERTTDKQEPTTRANSIVGAEQPDPGADPTTRLGLLRPAVQRDGEEKTADNPRTKGVLDLERPADETADDTRRLVVPPPRRPQDDEPTTRL